VPENCVPERFWDVSCVSCIARPGARHHDQHPSFPNRFSQMTVATIALLRDFIAFSPGVWRARYLASHHETRRWGQPGASPLWKTGRETCCGKPPARLCSSEVSYGWERGRGRATVEDGICAPPATAASSAVTAEQRQKIPVKDVFGRRMETRPQTLRLPTGAAVLLETLPRLPTGCTGTLAPGHGFAWRPATQLFPRDGLLGALGVFLN